MRLLVLLLLSLTACATQAQHPSSPEERKPTPSTVTRENPGGDAAHPVDAALTRLLQEPIGLHVDKFETLEVPLADRLHWRRVRFIGYPTRAGFRYGDDHFAVVLLDYRQAEGGDTPAECLSRFVDRAYDMAARFDLEVDKVEQGLHKPAESEAAVWRIGAVPPDKSVDAIPFARAAGHFTTLTNRDHYLTAVVGYRSWPGTCLVHGFAVRIGSDEALATRVVDRWMAELAPRLRWQGRVHATPPIEDR